MKSQGSSTTKREQRLSHIPGFTLALALGLSLTWNATAGMFEQRLEYSPGTHNYRANEWQVDVFGTWGSLDREDFDDDSMGFGLGGGYFFTRYLGVGVETYVEDFEAPNHVDFSVIGRYPLQFLGMAPYALAGVGRQFEDVSQWTGHIGGGAEFRLNPTTGLFTDIRGVFAEDTEDIALIRFGIRLAF